MSFPKKPFPENKITPNGPNHALDCAVINHLHQVRANHALSPYDTVRGLYQEGDGIFEGSKIMAKTHIQICVRRPEISIHGYFRVPSDSFAEENY